jgi:hypothetical protein
MTLTDSLSEVATGAVAAQRMRTLARTGSSARECMEPAVPPEHRTAFLDGLLRELLRRLA